MCEEGTRAERARVCVYVKRVCEERTGVERERESGERGRERTERERGRKRVEREKDFGEGVHTSTFSFPHSGEHIAVYIAVGVLEAWWWWWW